MEAYSGVFYGTRVPCIFFFFFLNFEKIELRKRDISLISLGKWAEGYIICAKRAFAQIPMQRQDNTKTCYRRGNQKTRRKIFL